MYRRPYLILYRPKYKLYIKELDNVSGVPGIEKQKKKKKKKKKEKKKKKKKTQKETGGLKFSDKREHPTRRGA